MANIARILEEYKKMESSILPQMEREVSNFFSSVKSASESLLPAIKGVFKAIAKVHTELDIASRDTTVYVDKVNKGELGKAIEQQEKDSVHGQVKVTEAESKSISSMSH